VARLDSTATGWTEPVAGALNEVAGTRAAGPQLLAVGGVPAVGWAEGHAGGRSDVKLARLEPEVLGTQVTPTATSATVTTRLRTFGLSPSVWFAYGPAGSPLDRLTQPAAASGPEASVAATLTGLTPRTAYHVQPVVSSAIGADLAGPVVDFSTTKKNGRASSH
jgi:hypothetical protein